MAQINIDQWPLSTVLTNVGFLSY